MKRPLSMIIPLAVLGLFAFGQSQDIVSVKVVPALESSSPARPIPSRSRSTSGRLITSTPSSLSRIS